MDKRMEQKKQIEQWEYMEYSVSFESFGSMLEDQRNLNELGKDGWEAYAIHEEQGLCGSITTYHLKRKKGGER